MAAQNIIEGRFYLDGAPVRIEIDRGRISRVIRPDEQAAGQSPYIAPGFIDNQVNGYVGHGFTDPELTADRVQEIIRNLWQVGVTSFLPTLITSSPERLEQNFGILSRAVRETGLESSIPGFHLEGPYISPDDGFRGAHNQKYVTTPSWEQFARWQEAAEGRIIHVSLAPELEGALGFIRRCTSEGIVIGLAHHNASARRISEAVDAGAAIATHLGNGCANTIHRHDNPLWGQLAEDRLMISMIADGFHLRCEEVRTFYKVKGPDRILLVSDTTQLAGMPPGEYTWDDKTVVLSDEGVIRLPEQDVLAGAAAPITQGVETVMRYTGCNLAEAVQMASTNPARLHGLHDRGAIQTGRRADLVLFTLEHGAVKVQQTILDGETVYIRE